MVIITATILPSNPSPNPNQVRFQLEKDGMTPLPDLRIPQEGRVRHGFWFMAFEREALKLSAAQSLRDRAFATECGGPARSKCPGSQQSRAAIHRPRGHPLAQGCPATIQAPFWAHLTLTLRP